MRYLSMFSGIEAASVAWKPLGWQCAAVCEIEPFPSAVLAHHYPNVPNLGDVTKADFNAIGPVDLIVFGSPCQSFSIAGKRLGMDDPRGNLALLAGQIVYRKRPNWFVFENVPGLLSSDGGWDFGTLLAAYAGHPAGSAFAPPADGWKNSGIVEPGPGGYGLAWRVLDAQYFGVPQRRRRVFVVGYLGDWRPAGAVLFERHSLSGHPAPRRETREGFAAATAPSLTASGRGVERTGESRGQDPVIAVDIEDVAKCLSASHTASGRQDPSAETFVPVTYSIMPQNSGKDYKAREVQVAQPIMAGGPVGGNQGGDYIVQPVPFDTTQITSAANYSKPKAGDPCHPLAAGAHAPAIALQEVGKRTGKSTTDVRAGLGIAAEGDPMFTLQAGAQHGVGHGSAVRRLTPRECERLMGFSDDYTLIPYRGKIAADGPRYRALGNSMAVPVISWLGERIQLVETLISQQEKAA